MLKNARLIDGTGAAARDGASILVEGATLGHVRPLQLDAPSAEAAEIVDVRGRTVIPGLVETQIHLSLEAIGAATRWGAELMRMDDRIGTLVPGKRRTW